MRCRWRRDPSQRRLLPRLKAHVRATALAALVLSSVCAGELPRGVRQPCPPACCRSGCACVPAPFGSVLGAHSAFFTHTPGPSPTPLGPAPAACAVAGLNSLVVPLALEAEPAASQRCAPPRPASRLPPAPAARPALRGGRLAAALACPLRRWRRRHLPARQPDLPRHAPPAPRPPRCSADQILRFHKELSFLVTTGRHADTALWYQRLAAAAAQAQQAEAALAAAGGHAGNASSAGAAAGEAAAAGVAEVAWLAPAAAPPPPVGGEGAAGFLAAALEGSSNSSRLDAKLAVWSTLWQPLLPQHWLRAVLAAGSRAGRRAGCQREAACCRRT